MTYSRPHWGWFLCLFVLSLPLFFGLFFGLNYKEIIRNGWPLTTCTVNNATLSTRYCCYSDCSPSCFESAPNGATTCGDLINQVNGGYSPAACAANTSVCPEAIGTICDEGYRCCNQCCSTCQSCTTSCPTSSSSCSQSCTTSPCNCYCCSSTYHRQCTLRCPTCYSVNLIMSYSPYNGYIQSNVPYSQDFSQDSSKAEAFLANHPVNSTSKCYYNPKSLTELSLDVSFTAWKWAVSAIFGMIPILFALGFTMFHFCCYPVYAIGRRLQRGRRRDSGKRRAEHVAEDAESRPAEIANDLNVDKNQDEAPPPYEKER
ncbi:hypothetical protein EDD85DRAFT_525840 [Armillaria nabsnona]|nr:hypothetical protein EDD85DRAFT_525840 [Armillaria nabsnona]